MADLDSRSKRNSGINVALMWARPTPLPDSTVGAGDRQHLVGYYSGIAAQTPATGGGTQNTPWWEWFDESKKI